MKKILLLAIAAMMAMVSVNAQDEFRNEVSVAYGAGSNTDIVASIGKGMFTGKQLDYWGPISAEYFHYNKACNFAFGAVAAIGGCKWDDHSDAKSTYFTVMPAVKFKWLNRTHFAMYSKAAVGLTVDSQKGTNEDKTETMFNWQASLVGMEFGGAFRGFVEIGTGEQGIILGGLRYKF